MDNTFPIGKTTPIYAGEKSVRTRSGDGVVILDERTQEGAVR